MNPLRRIESDDAAIALRQAEYADQPHPVVPATTGIDAETAHLPADHPQWVRDAVAISSRARALVARLKPVVVTIRTFWDHRFRSIVVSGRSVSVDSSGSYRTGA